GLPLVKMLVEAHDGSVVASSPGPDKGSEFLVTLPKVEGPKTILKKEAALKLKGKPRRVLIVDDEIDTASTLAALLKREGHQTCVANDADTALELIENFHPEVALLDLGLPKTNGYELAKKIQLK